MYNNKSFFVDWLCVYCVTLLNIFYMYSWRDVDTHMWITWASARRPWGGGVIVSLYAPATVTRAPGLHGLVWRTAPLSRLLRQARRYEDPHGIKTKEGKHTFFVVIWFNKVIIFQPLKVFLLNFHWLIALWDGLTQSERSHNLYYFIDYKFKEVPYMYFKHQLLFAKDL